jgi:phosphoribosylformylglycinamidine synthase
MAQPRVLILRAPGTNCDMETAFAFERAGAKTERWHINRLLENAGLVGDFQILCIPGGFSYGDDVAAGRILANQIQHHLADRLAEFKAADRLILGICNGFQVLIKSGVLLENDPAQGPAATLTWNDSGKFEDRWVRLGVQGERCVFLRGIEAMELPVAHAEGKFVTRDPAVLKTLADGEQLVLKYLPLSAEAEKGTGPVCAKHPPGRAGKLDLSPFPVPYPDNPNGSQADVAGICDTTGRVLGLMPHPERHIDPTQHPRWTRGEARDPGDGFQVFRNAVEYFA